MKYFLLCSLLLSVCATVRSQGALTVLGDPNDILYMGQGQLFDGLGAIDATYTTVGVVAGSPPALGAGYFVFQLPEIVAGHRPVVTTASLSLNVHSVSPTSAFGLDLYGLAGRDKPPPDPLGDPLLNPLVDPETDHYIGEYNPSLATLNQVGMLLQDDLLPHGNTQTGWVQTSNNGSAALAEYLTGQYGLDGSGAGKYVVLRLNPDLNQEDFAAAPFYGPAGATIYFAGLIPDPVDPVAMTPPEDRPRLTLEFAAVPEPAAAMIWSLAAAGVLLRRRK